MTSHLEDCFYDCQSDSEIEDVGDSRVDHFSRRVGGYSPPDQLMPYPDDPVEIRNTLERVVRTSRLLLRSVGGKTDYIDANEPSASHSFFYPASLEICARLVTDKSCTIPPRAQCRLRGDPITLKLPMELNPINGQVNVNIFQPAPKPLSCKCLGAGDRRKSDVEGVLEAAQGYSIPQHAGKFQGSGVMRRHTQRHDCMQKSGRKVRWPDFM